MRNWKADRGRRDKRMIGTWRRREVVYAGREWRRRDGIRGKEATVGRRGGMARRRVRNVNVGRRGLGGRLDVSFYRLTLSIEVQI